MNIEETKKLTSSIQGWIYPKEGELFYSLASKIEPPNVIVEIGSWKGKSSVWLACGSLNGYKCKVYCIDTFKGNKEHSDLDKSNLVNEFKQNIKRANATKIVKLIIGNSKEVSDEIPNSIGLLFIDGEHSFKEVNSDFNTYFNKVSIGGIVAFHDVIKDSWKGVCKVVEKNFLYGKKFKDINRVGCTVYATKVKD